MKLPITEKAMDHWNENLQSLLYFTKPILFLSCVIQSDWRWAAVQAQMITYPLLIILRQYQQITNKAATTTTKALHVSWDILKIQSDKNLPPLLFIFLFFFSPFWRHCFPQCLGSACAVEAVSWIINTHKSDPFPNLLSRLPITTNTLQLMLSLRLKAR